MSLVPCRACEHQVDTSALACPQCGATDPGRPISRQRRDARNFVIQLIVWLVLIGSAGWYVWHSVIPLVRQFVVKTPGEAPPTARP